MTTITQNPYDIPSAFYVLNKLQYYGDETHMQDNIKIKKNFFNKINKIKSPIKKTALSVKLKQHATAHESFSKTLHAYLHKAIQHQKIQEIS